MVWIIAPAWKCVVSFLKHLYSLLNYRNKRDMLNRTSSSVLGTGHWGPGFVNTDAHAHLLHWGHFRKPHRSLLPLLLLASLAPYLQWAKSLRTGPFFQTFFLLSFPCLPPTLPMQSSSKAPCDRENTTEAREEQLKDQEHKDILLLLVPPLTMEHRALGALPRYWLSPAAPVMERRQNPLLTSLFCWDQWTQGQWRSFSLPPGGPYEVHSASQ